jgi:hypothetical protein
MKYLGQEDVSTVKYQRKVNSLRSQIEFKNYLDKLDEKEFKRMPTEAKQS